MAKKTVKKNVKKVKAFKGLKAYIVLIILSVTAIALMVLAVVWNSSSNTSIVNLPETGDTVYYNRCLIENINGILGYADQSVQKCTYMGETNNGYNYQTPAALLLCTANDIKQMNICTSGMQK